MIDCVRFIKDCNQRLNNSNYNIIYPEIKPNKAKSIITYVTKDLGLCRSKTSSKNLLTLNINK